MGMSWNKYLNTKTLNNDINSLNETEINPQSIAIQNFRKRRVFVKSSYYLNFVNISDILFDLRNGKNYFNFMCFIRLKKGLYGSPR